MAPLAQENSGEREGKRAVRGGRRDVRAILYVMAGEYADTTRTFQRLRNGWRPKENQIAAQDLPDLPRWFGDAVSVHRKDLAN